ncbi:MAG TPA: hypothetical protein VFS00_26055, partial [Polyangiaceae bacterium]|nr:hypothetical protein [Polyangiaceae bacterium]
GGPAALAAGAALALLRWGPWWPKGAEAPGDGWGLEVQVLPGPRTRGNESAEAGVVVARGTSLALKAAPGPGGELRVYRDRRELVLRCPGGPGCREAHEGGRGVLRAELTLGSQGLYRAVLLSGPKVPPPSGEEDADLAAAVAAGAKIHVEPPWQVY